MTKVMIVMGSISDWPTMKETAKVLDDLGVSYDKKIISAHRTPNLLTKFAKGALDNDVSVIIAGAGGAAHLPGMIAANTIVPVIGVPVQSKALNGLDSLLSIVQMPSGVPVATVAIGTSGAKNAGYLAAQILAMTNPEIRKNVINFRKEAAQGVLESEAQLDEE
ncbi:5-(carboxyamino)imidazole ribonucleotide mutase [Fructilactobacillus sanfranciscensis]|uniref:5-(carboxyamino)imidazole ribonucleotide mutase n=1 Tax=Fructilactobacillus sanfranciscensis TaxID=1625 RepID=UPI0006F02BFA|nr:5-(carboxyamino)imidazole ribonucleotide mutase [Fructilactobacillus sanfranciscensis]KRM81095.1 phosphoribosylaminoimidazole carboxylase catalytic subunit [Fructilactobacillus sanfranciscensis DSM 20451]MDN4462431.1 5-(carboxyamino)imidazole ribonucleotide mutase [Fructilactobacillus sanfranciscensis]NDR61415.1 5-(carboxyamino)imidazole ribonucleotide mutase [Fructilactobacillus sanfranciscensis]POH19475.1 5-(carboxyamino)imidazole ribonucleotide mutase [Fructilactobacillus sanfranciscensis